MVYRHTETEIKGAERNYQARADESPVESERRKSERRKSERRKKNESNKGSKEKRSCFDHL